MASQPLYVTSNEPGPSVFGDTDNMTVNRPVSLNTLLGLVVAAGLGWALNSRFTSNPVPVRKERPSSSSQQVASALQLFCVVDGETSCFSVKIRLDATVDDLKKEIKTQNSPELDIFAAKNLRLFNVNVPAKDMSIEQTPWANRSAQLAKGHDPHMQAERLLLRSSAGDGHSRTRETSDRW
jgi:hypothetical protein